MAYRNIPGGYVKFLRGTPAAWDSILTKDEDTLYFIAEQGATRGALYLGNKLISGGGTSNVVSLQDLEDVLIGANIPSDAVLVYNSDNDVWEPVALATALADIIEPMTGATATENGLAGLVPQPLAGQQTLFLRGDATWANPTSAVENSLNNLISDLYGTDVEGSSIRSIVNSAIDDLVGNAPTTLDTLEELANWVTEHEQVIDITQAAVDIENLTDAMFGTLANPSETDADLVNMVQQDGVIRILSNLQTIVGTNEYTGLQGALGTLEGRVSDNESAITNLNSSLASLTSRVTTVESDLADVKDALRWVDVEYYNDGE